MIKFISLIIDIILCIISAPFFFIYIFAMLARRKKNEYKSYFVLIDSANVNSIYKKFGSLNVIKTQHYNKIFKNHFVMYHKTPNKIDLFIAENFLIMERIFYNRLQLFSHFKNLLFIIKIIVNNDISLLRATAPYEMGLKGLIASKVTGVPFCVSLHTDIDNRKRFDTKAKPKILNSYLITDIIENFVFKHTHYILPIRESMINYIVSHGGQKEKCYIIPHGVDLSFFTEDNSAAVDAFLNKYCISGNVISFVGRLEKQNYTEDIIKISELLIEKRKDVTVFIAGDGSQMPHFIRLQKKYPDNIVVPGAIPQKEAFALRKLSYVNLSLMGGFSLIESCASGNPVISYNVEWHYELIQNNVTGFLLEENDIHGVVDKIIYLLNNPHEKSRIGNNAKELAIKKHSLTKTNAVKAEIYKRIMDGKNVNS